MTFLTTTVESVLNQALHLDPPSLQALGTLTGKIIRVELQGLNLQFNLFPDNQGIIILNQYHGEVNAQVHGAPFTLLRLLLQRDATLLDNPDVTVQGDVKIAQQLLTVLQNLHLNWEEQLTRLGGIPAHQLARFMQKSQEYTVARLNTLQRHLLEYLQQETRHFPTRVEVNRFFHAITSLQNDVDQLAQRVRQLQQLQI